MASYSWVPSSQGKVPPNAIVAGKDVDGGLLYVGKVIHEGDTVPCKIAPSAGGAFVAFAGEEHSKFDYEVLCGSNVAWQSASNGQVPKNAIVAGQTSDGEKLYIGRAIHQSSLTPGKVHPSHGVLYISFGGKEITHKDYEVAIQI
ncbi:uncharacterized protein LOC135837847 [Planococcus citri]|uniref:uncharacterized protein LOC135837847 n=1 Tax=Planococcus citri TaxID=170843 RepID=UPI0031F87F0F